VKLTFALPNIRDYANRPTSSGTDLYSDCH
jgi:hypothetical protein